MKKTIISFLAITSLIFTGCFIDSDTATVRINLGNLPVAKVEKKSIIDRFLMIFAKEAVAQSTPPPVEITAVHLAAFDSNKQVLSKKTIAIGNYPDSNIVEFDVPARNNITILVLGENESHRAGYYGYASANLNAGETVELTILIKAAVWGWTGKQITTTSYFPHIIEWESAGIPVRYFILNSSTRVVLYNGYGTEANVDDSGSYIFYVEFEMFKLNTDEFFYSDV